jgi:cell division protein FtsW (lipid II flippase)
MNKRSVNFGEVVVMSLLLLIGGGLIYGSQFNREVGERTLQLLEKPFFATILGVILLLAVVLRVLDRFRKSKDVFIDYQSEGGSVGISTRAIQSGLDRSLRRLLTLKPS